MSPIRKTFISILLFITGCFSFFRLSAQNFDVDILETINSPHPTSHVWRGATASAYPIILGIPAGMWIIGELSKNKKLEHNAYKTAGSVFIATVVSQGLKIIIDRKRPYEKYQFIYPYDGSEKGRSFPSAHTSLAFATATSLSLTYKKWYIMVPAYLWATGIGYSRIYLGEHYPTDVIGGAIIGAASAWLSHWASKKIFKRN